MFVSAQIFLVIRRFLVGFAKEVVYINTELSPKVIIHFMSLWTKLCYSIQIKWQARCPQLPRSCNVQRNW